MAKLTPKQERFVAEYLVDLNATQAAIRAGYSRKSAARIGVELLNKTQVAQAVAEAQAKRAAKVERSAQDVILDIRALTQEVWRDGDLRTALKGLELEGRHLGMFTEKVQHSGTVETVVVIREGRADG